jgi:hypothetical protein
LGLTLTAAPQLNTVRVCGLGIDDPHVNRRWGDIGGISESMVVDPDSIAQSARGDGEPSSVIAEIGDVDVRHIEKVINRERDAW